MQPHSARKMGKKRVKRGVLFPSVTTGGGIPRTKHLRARMNMAREAIQQERVRVVHCRAHLMKADGLTKPLEGTDFSIFAKPMLCKA